MQVEMVRLDPDVAKVKAKRYAREIKKARLHDADKAYVTELLILRKAYSELAKGTKILDLNAVMIEAGFTSDMRPMLAIGRSDLKTIKFTWQSHSTSIRFMDDDTSYWRSRIASSLIRDVDVKQRHGRTNSNGQGVTLEGFSAVPLPPPGVIPEGVKLEKCFTLWEVKEWQRSRHTSIVDPDPYLLKHIGGPFYAVLAEWELTDLETSLQGFMRRV